MWVQLLLALLILEILAQTVLRLRHLQSLQSQEWNQGFWKELFGLFKVFKFSRLPILQYTLACMWYLSSCISHINLLWLVRRWTQHVQSIKYTSIIDGPWKLHEFLRWPLKIIIWSSLVFIIHQVLAINQLVKHYVNL